MGGKRKKKPSTHAVRNWSSLERRSCCQRGLGWFAPDSARSMCFPNRWELAEILGLKNKKTIICTVSSTLNDWLIDWLLCCVEKSIHQKSIPVLKLGISRFKKKSWKYSTDLAKSGLGSHRFRERKINKETTWECEKNNGGKEEIWDGFSRNQSCCTKGKPNDLSQFFPFFFLFPLFSENSFIYAAFNLFFWWQKPPNVF